jgi:hypothetical protein
MDVTLYFFALSIKKHHDYQEVRIQETEEPLAKRLSSRNASIRDPDFQVVTNWIPAKSLPE